MASCYHLISRMDSSVVEVIVGRGLGVGAGLGGAAAHVPPLPPVIALVKVNGVMESRIRKLKGDEMAI